MDFAVDVRDVEVVFAGMEVDCDLTGAVKEIGRNVGALCGFTVSTFIPLVILTIFLGIIECSKKKKQDVSERDTHVV